MRVSPRVSMLNNQTYTRALDRPTVSQDIYGRSPYAQSVYSPYDTGLGVSDQDVEDLAVDVGNLVATKDVDKMKGEYNDIVTRTSIIAQEPGGAAAIASQLNGLASEALSSEDKETRKVGERMNKVVEKFNKLAMTAPGTKDYDKNLKDATEEIKDQSKKGGGFWKKALIIGGIAAGAIFTGGAVLGALGAKGALAGGIGALKGAGGVLASAGAKTFGSKAALAATAKSAGIGAGINAGINLAVGDRSLKGTLKAAGLGAASGAAFSFVGNTIGAAGAKAGVNSRLNKFATKGGLTGVARNGVQLLAANKIVSTFTPKPGQPNEFAGALGPGANAGFGGSRDGEVIMYNGQPLLVTPDGQLIPLGRG